MRAWLAFILPVSSLDMSVFLHARASAPSSPRARRPLTRALLVFNPASRGGLRALSQVTRALREAGVAFEVVETIGWSRPTEALRSRIAAGPSYDAVLALGGDGTAMKTASALATLPDAPALGIIAVGTGNVLARTIGVPRDPARAVHSLLDAETSPVDLGRIENGPAFAIGLGVGLDASMIAGASAVMKRRLGAVAYVWPALRAGLRLERFHVSIEVDGTTHDTEACSVLIANFGTVLGDMFCFGDGIAHHDGKLDVCVFSPMSLVDASRILFRLLFGGVSQDRCVRTIRGERIRISTDVPRQVQADGELLGLTPVSVQVEPAAVQLLVPRTPARRWRLRRSGQQVRPQLRIVR